MMRLLMLCFIFLSCCSEKENKASAKEIELESRVFEEDPLLGSFLESDVHKQIDSVVESVLPKFKIDEWKKLNTSFVNEFPSPSSMSHYEIRQKDNIYLLEIKETMGSGELLLNELRVYYSIAKSQGRYQSTGWFWQDGNVKKEDVMILYSDGEATSSRWPMKSIDRIRQSLKKLIDDNNLKTVLFVPRITDSDEEIPKNDLFDNPIDHRQPVVGCFYRYEASFAKSLILSMYEEIQETNRQEFYLWKDNADYSKPYHHKKNKTYDMFIISEKDDFSQVVRFPVVFLEKQLILFEELGCEPVKFSDKVQKYFNGDKFTTSEYYKDDL